MKQIRKKTFWLVGLSMILLIQVLVDRFVDLLIDLSVNPLPAFSIDHLRDPL